MARKAVHKLSGQTGMHTCARFIILSRYRSGSNLISLAIQHRPEARMAGELFNLEKLAQRPESYVGDQVVDAFCHKSFASRAVGMKCMYGQACDIELDKDYWGANLPARIARYIDIVRSFMAVHRVATWQHLEDALVANRAIKIIHLVRENQLDAYVSFQLALRENNWLQRPYATASAGLEIDLADLENWFRNGVRFRGYYAERFREHACLDVTYDGLATSYSDTMERVGTFLGLSGLGEMPPPIAKQQVLPLPKVVANYAAAKAHFTGTEWERHFS